MATGILGAYGALTKRELSDYVMVGELSLDGGLRGVRGTLPIAVAAHPLGNFTINHYAGLRVGTNAIDLVPANDVESAQLTGGPGDNTFDVGGWLVPGSIDGQGGTNTLLTSSQGNTRMSTVAGRMQKASCVQLISSTGTALSGVPTRTGSSSTAATWRPCW